MKIELSKKPKNPTIIGGFPGFGLVAMIATEYLVNHLEVEEIGRIWSKLLPPMAAIHNSQLVQPLQVFYNKKFNIVIVQGLAAAKGVEWDIAEAMVQLGTMLKAKEILSLDGVAGQSKSGFEVYAYSSDKSTQKILSKKFQAMNSGIIVGVTGAVLVNAVNKIPATCLFAETMSGMPDSKAAAQLIKALDSYLNLKIDYKPLLKQASQFEDKLKGMMQQGKVAVQAKQEKEQELNYFG